MIITFKSIPSIWWREFIGLKNNTIRQLKMGEDDIRFNLLDDFINQPFDLQIEIMNSINFSCFIKQVTDVTFWEGWYIISWRDRK